MLLLAGYTLDRIVKLTEEGCQSILELASGIICSIPKRNVKDEALLAWANDMFIFNAPIALRIVDGVVVDAAMHRYTSVLALGPEGKRPVKVNICGESGTLRLTGPEAEDEYYPLLVNSLATDRKLMFFLGKNIEAVVELSADEIDNLKEMSSHPSPIEHPLAQLLASVK